MGDNYPMFSFLSYAMVSVYLGVHILHSMHLQRQGTHNCQQLSFQPFDTYMSSIDIWTCSRQLKVNENRNDVSFPLMGSFICKLEYNLYKTFHTPPFYSPNRPTKKCRPSQKWPSLFIIIPQNMMNCETTISSFCEAINVIL